MIKSQGAFRTISEVSEWLDTPTHVLRFWESKFTQIKPVKRAGGRRYYRPEDMALLGGIKTLLHEQGLTIKGVQKLLRDQGNRHVMALGPAGLPDLAPAEESARPVDAAPSIAPPQSARPVQVIAEPRKAPPLRRAEPVPTAPAFLHALAKADRRAMMQRVARIAPLVARLTEIRDRMAQG